uniref:Pre-mRNA-splicing factor 18 n=1 Tax=Glossina austeni TaxID=7395 RepID=A0A1A9UMD9_GLOAU
MQIKCWRNFNFGKQPLVFPLTFSNADLLSGQHCSWFSQTIPTPLNRNYIAASDAYLEMAIGNAPWPIGVTFIQIHSLAFRLGPRCLHIPLRQSTYAQPNNSNNNNFS